MIRNKIYRLTLLVWWLAIACLIWHTHYGWTFLGGGSLAPLYRPGDLIIYEKTQDVEVGDLVGFYPYPPSRVRYAKIVYVKKRDGTFYVAGPQRCGWRGTIKPEQIIGKEIFRWRR